MLIKVIVHAFDREFKIQTDGGTVACLQIKLRKYLKIHPAGAMFLFFKQPKYLLGIKTGYKEVLYPNGMLLSDIPGRPLLCSVLKENCFGAWSKGFVKAKIMQKKSLFVACITWSYYGLYHYDEMSVHESLIEAQEHLLKLRCDGKLILEDNNIS